MTNPVQEANLLGQSIWYDTIRRGMLKSGELQGLIDQGVTGLTANPTIFEKAIVGSTDYDEALLELARAGKSANECYEALIVGDIQAVADLLRPIYDRTGGADGYASLEVSPLWLMTPRAPLSKPGGFSLPSIGPTSWSKSRLLKRVFQPFGN